jgi:hypothetical protein
MAALQYLTVQDVLWINLTVTGHPQEFDYATLEEATFYQYAYGENKGMAQQAARFVDGFLKKKPLAAGNEGTAFVACLAFLRANGVELNLDDPLAWFRGIESGTHESLASIEKYAQETHHEGHHGPETEVPDAMKSVFEQYSETVAKLAAIPA